MPTDEAHDRTIDRARKIGGDLALTQAMNPDEEDSTGFSNADFPHAFALLAAENDAGLARLLLRYPRQAGLKVDPEWAASLRTLALSDQSPAEIAGAEAMFASWQSSAIASDREQLRGRVLWRTDADDSAVFIGGVGVPWLLRRAFRRAAAPGTPKAAGAMRLPATSIWKLDRAVLAEYADIIDRYDALRAWVIAHAANRGVDEPASAAETGLTVTMDLIAASNGRQVSVTWTPPFDADGVQLRDFLKLKLGGMWHPGDKHWVIDRAAARALVDVLQDVAPSAAVVAPEFEADNMELRYWRASCASDRSVIRVVADLPDAVVITTPRRNDELVSIMRETSGRWDGTVGGYRLPRDRLSAAATAIDRSVTLDGQCLLPVVRSHLAHIERARLIKADSAQDIPVLTPTGRRLKAFQQEGVAFLSQNVDGAILGDDMGLGKTIQSVVAADLAFPGEPVLVVCPASLKRNWANEIKHTLGDKAGGVQVVDGNKVLDDTARWVVINYEILARRNGDLRAHGFRVAIIDEAHRIKNPTAQRTKALLAPETGILHGIPTVWPMTGTPILNRPAEMLPILQAARHPLGANPGQFLMRYCGAVQNAYGWEFKGASNIAELGERLGERYLRRMKKDVLDLPPKIHQIVAVDLSPTEKAQYTKGIQRAIAGRDYRTVLVELSAARQMTALAKVPHTIAIAEDVVESAGKVLVFSTYQAVIDAVVAHFGAKAVMIDGRTPTGRRQAIVNAFQSDPDIAVFVGNVEAAGVGLTLTAAQDVLFNDVPWTPALVEQAEDRAYRIGTTGTVNVRYLVAEGTLDATLHAMHAVKRGYATSVEIAHLQREGEGPVIAALRALIDSHRSVDCDIEEDADEDNDEDEDEGDSLSDNIRQPARAASMRM